MDRHDVARTAALVGGALRQLRLIQTMIEKPRLCDAIDLIMDDLREAEQVLQTPSSHAAYMRKWRAQKAGMAAAAPAASPSAPPKTAAPTVVNHREVTVNHKTPGDDIDVLTSALDRTGRKKR